MIIPAPKLTNEKQTETDYHSRIKLALLETLHAHIPCLAADNRRFRLARQAVRPTSALARTLDLRNGSAWSSRDFEINCRQIPYAAISSSTSPPFARITHRVALAQYCDQVALLHFKINALYRSSSLWCEIV